MKIRFGLRARKSGLVVKTLSVSLLGLTLGACEGVDDGAPASEPTAVGAEESFDVVTVKPGPDGQLMETTTRMTESQWQVIVDRRIAAAKGIKPPVRSNSSVFETQQATVIDNCADPGSDWVYSGPNQTGTRTCLFSDWSDTGFPNMAYSLGYSVQSYWTGNICSAPQAGCGAGTLICTSNFDCNLYTCGQGSSVWLNASSCPGGTFCRGNVFQPPPQSLLSPHYVHVQGARPFACH
jgi:hypothetical protein